jgi:hypothetical protein
MADPPSDLIAAWQKFVSDWEKQINQVSAQVMGTDEYSRVMNQATKFSVVARQHFDKQIEEFLKTVHMPSKDDVAAIHDRLASIEESIEQLRLALSGEKRRPDIPITRGRKAPGPR